MALTCSIGSDVVWLLNVIERPCLFTPPVQVDSRFCFSEVEEVKVEHQAFGNFFDISNELAFFMLSMSVVFLLTLINCAISSSVSGPRNQVTVRFPHLIGEAPHASEHLHGTVRFRLNVIQLHGFCPTDSATCRGLNLAGCEQGARSRLLCGGTRREGHD